MILKITSSFIDGDTFLLTKGFTRRDYGMRENIITFLWTIVFEKPLEQSRGDIK